MIFIRGWRTTLCLSYIKLTRRIRLLVKVSLFLLVMILFVIWMIATLIIIAISSLWFIVITAREWWSTIFIISIYFGLILIFHMIFLMFWYIDFLLISHRSILFYLFFVTFLFFQSSLIRFWFKNVWHIFKIFWYHIFNW